MSHCMSGGQPVLRTGSQVATVGAHALAGLLPGVVLGVDGESPLLAMAASIKL